MSDVLVSDVPDEVLAVIDRLAAGEGLTRGEYLRRWLIEEAQGSAG
ncbi:ribbon-helix-helix protein, CopG family [Kribbella sp. NPDC026611]